MEELLNNTVGLSIALWKVRADFDMNLILFIHKISEIESNHYETTFKFYEYGWKGTQILIDQKGITKKELLQWFDETFQEHCKFECTYKRYFERNNWKEIKLIIDKP